MSIWKTLLATAALAAGLAAPLAAQDDPVRIALVPKALGIGFFEAAAKGAEEAAAELGNVEIIFTGPTDTTAEGQIEVINALIAQEVDAIAVSANDRDALVPALKKAMDRGITVISWDSGVAPEGRQMNLNPSSPALIGNMIIKLAADHLPDGGDVAVLSASATATNQNTWIEEMNKVKDQYPGINVVTTVYGDDLSDKSYRETQGLMQTYPDLKAIIAPTSVGIVAAAQAVTDAGKVGADQRDRPRSAVGDGGARRERRDQVLRDLESDRPRLFRHDDRLQPRDRRGEGRGRRRHPDGADGRGRRSTRTSRARWPTPSSTTARTSTSSSRSSDATSLPAPAAGRHACPDGPRHAHRPHRA